MRSMDKHTYLHVTLVPHLLLTFTRIKFKAKCKQICTNIWADVCVIFYEALVDCNRLVVNKIIKNLKQLKLMLPGVIAENYVFFMLIIKKYTKFSAKNNLIVFKDLNNFEFLNMLKVFRDKYLSFES